MEAALREKRNALTKAKVLKKTSSGEEVKAPPKRVDRVNRQSVAFLDAQETAKELIEGGGVEKQATEKKRLIRHQGSIIHSKGDYSQNALNDLFAAADGGGGGEGTIAE
eukprot:gene9314-23804_t